MKQPFHALLVTSTAALVLLSGPARAASVFGQNFSLNSVVAHDSSFIQLTDPAIIGDRASAFVSTPLALLPGASFETAFAFKILGGTAGADGMTLAFRSDGHNIAGLAGGNLGFYGVRGGEGTPLPFGPAYAVAVDTWRNTDYGDTGNNNISFLDQTSYQVRRTAPAPYDLNSGDEYHVWASYDGQARTMSVFLSDTTTKPLTPLVTDPIDLAAWLGPQTYIGFTAATGGTTNGHYVTAFSIAPIPEPQTWTLLVAGLAAVAFVVRRRSALLET